MVATVRHVTSSSGLRKFQTDGFLSDRVYQHKIKYHKNPFKTETDDAKHSNSTQYGKYHTLSTSFR